MRYLCTSGDGYVTIYIDVLIFTNTLINYCILSLVQKFTKNKTNEFKLIIASLLGSLFSLSIFINTVNHLLSLIIKIICSVLMCVISFSFISFYTLIKNTILIFLSTITYTAIVICIYNIFKPDKLFIHNDNIYFQIDPLTLIILSVIIYYSILLIQRLINIKDSATLVNLCIVINKQKYSCIGKIDTACSLTEPFSGSPVIIVEKDLIKEYSQNKIRIIPYKALGSNGIISAVKAEQVYIDKKMIPKEIYIGFYENTIDPNFKAIINHNIIR